MAFISGKFEFNGINSDTMGVTLVHLDTGMLERQFGIKKTINREKIRYRDVPIYYNTERNFYTFPITIAKINQNDLYWTEEERIKISQWLFTSDNQFHDFISEDYNLVFPLQFTEGRNFDNYSNQGYVTFTVEMASPYPYTLPAENYYDLSSNTTTTIIEIDNSSNVIEYYKPMIQFELTGGTTLFKIKNLTVGGEETIFQNLTLLDTINLDSQTQRIESKLGKNYISDSNFNFKFPRLIYGTNRLEITGSGFLTIKTTFPVMI